MQPIKWCQFLQSYSRTILNAMMQKLMTGMILNSSSNVLTQFQETILHDAKTLLTANINYLQKIPQVT